MEYIERNNNDNLETTTNTIKSKNKESKDCILPPLKAIRAFCMWCACDQLIEIRLCPVGTCALHSTRFGKGPGPSPPGRAEEARRHIRALRRPRPHENPSTTRGKSVG